MGYAAYQLKRVNESTEEVLGEITVIFPKVSTYIKLEEKYNLTSADLIAYTDFPIESTVFAPIYYSTRNYIELLKNFGFKNAINIFEHIGENWYLNNNNYIQITGDERTQTAYFNRADGTTVWASSAARNDAGTFFRFATLPCLVGDDSESIYGSIVYSLSGAEEGTITFQGEKEYPEQYRAKKLDFFANAIPISISNDPYNPGGNTDVGGGAGDLDDTSDPISIPALPSSPAVDTGFLTLFNPTLEELQNLASYMWSDLFDLNGWKKIFANPMDAILGLSIVPVAIPSIGRRVVAVGNIQTDVSLTVAATQYVEVDCGTLNVNEFWGAYLDYSPYTKAEIYLPYIGTHALDVDDIMNKPVHVVYHVDILSGACCAYVSCGNSVLYSFLGQCTSSIPITGNDWTSVINGALSIAGSIGSMVATGGASAPMQIGSIASTAVNQMKPSVEKSGSMSGTGGLMSIQTPYMILTRPRQAVPRDQNAYTGYPSFINELLSDLTGYTEIESIHLENIPATASELSEIESLLKGGVIF